MTTRELIDLLLKMPMDARVNLVDDEIGLPYDVDRVVYRPKVNVVEIV